MSFGNKSTAMVNAKAVEIEIDRGEIIVWGVFDLSVGSGLETTERTKMATFEADELPLTDLRIGAVTGIESGENGNSVVMTAESIDLEASGESSKQLVADGAPGRSERPPEGGQPPNGDVADGQTERSGSSDDAGDGGFIDTRRLFQP
jgi:hypothetical protein